MRLCPAAVERSIGVSPSMAEEPQPVLDEGDRDPAVPESESSPEPAEPAQPGESAESAPSRIVARLRRTLEPRADRIAASVTAGVLLCISFPPFGWWLSAFVAFALLAWVMVDGSTTKAGGFGYGFLAGLAFFVPLHPVDQRTRRAVPVAGALGAGGTLSRPSSACSR